MRAGVLSAVAVGGAIGTLARAALVAGEGAGAGLSWRILAANLAGAFVLGAVAARLRHGRRRALLGAGVCGGLTTFSTLQVDTLLLIDAGRTGLAAAGLAVSLAGGLAAALAGARLARVPA